MTSRQKRKIAFFSAGTMVLALLAVLDICTGDIPLKVLIGQDLLHEVMSQIRIPRVLTAILAGGALSAAGAQMQAIFRNPLADPHIMGVSAGAGTGAAVATIVLAGGAGTIVPGGLSIAIAAFIGAAAASFLIVTASSRVRSGNTLLLVGVMLGFIFSAITSIIEYSASEESLRIFYSWSAGSFAGNRISETVILAGLTLAGLATAVLNIKGLDISLFGDDYARMSGAPSRRIRLLAMSSCCLMTGAVTAFCGPIGFVGIVAPHAARWLSGTSSHRTVLPGSMLCGATLAVISDILSSCFGRQLPSGSTMAMIGIPAVIYILSRNGNHGQD